MLLVKYGIPLPTVVKTAQGEQIAHTTTQRGRSQQRLLPPPWQLPANLLQLPSQLITLGSSPPTASLPLWSSPKILWGMWLDVVAVA